MQHVIATKNLTKHFGATRALDGLDLRVAAGEVHGFLGPNGAGKSTAIRILLGLLQKTSGEVSLLGRDPWRDAVELHKQLAYVPGDVSLWPNLTGGEAIDLLVRLRHDGVNAKRRTELLERFELDPTKKFRTYSKGNRQKVALVAALASDVDLYILDEPTSGLDPLMEAMFQHTIQELKATGKTVLLSSHILAEAEALCDRITIIREGRAVESGTLAELRHLTRTTVKVHTKKPLTGLQKASELHGLNTQETYAEFEVSTDDLERALQMLIPFGIADLITSPPTLEDLFMRHYGDIHNSKRQHGARV